MKVLYNNEKYLSEELINQCFEYGNHLKIDKVITGNGFSTAFLKKIPKENKINIMIAPNKAVVIDKEKAYNSGGLDTPNSIGFFYKEGKSNISNNYDLMVFVADSFFLQSNELFKMVSKIDLILIDEAHSIEIQSSFRWVLKDFDFKINKFLNNSTAISSVTATPNHFTNIDIEIKNTIITPIEINITNNRLNSIDRLIKDIKNKEKVLIATNSMAVLYRLRNRKHEVKGNFIVGTSFLRSCVSSFKVINDPLSNITIISSRGFEGFDLMGENYKVYFFEDRAKEHESFYISNLYQAINRCREGGKYVEYSVRYLGDDRKKTVDIIAINNYIDDKEISVEQKQKKKFEQFHKYVVFNQNKDGVFSIKKNDVSINLDLERELYDNGFDNFTSFLSKRKIRLKYLNEGQPSIPHIRLPIGIKEDRLKMNEHFIHYNGLFSDDFNLPVVCFDEYKFYKKHINNYIIKKIYDSPELGVRDLTDRERIGIDLLTNYKAFSKLVGKIVKKYNKRSIEKYGVKESKEFRDSFKLHSEKTVAQLIQGFLNDRINFPANWVANRNYNILVGLGIDEIKEIANVFNVEFLEVDIKSAFPRILYSINGLELPSNFYGEDKKNKIKINVKLNSFRYDATKKTEKKIQRNNAINIFKRLGLADIVINYLIDSFFESKYKGDLFNFLSFYEKKIISEIKTNLESFENIGAIRRHDSIILLGNNSDVSFVNSFKFLNSGGWFDVKNTTVITPHISDINADLF